MTAQRVVVGVDGTLIAVRALDWAAEEAERRGATLHILYAVTDHDEAGPVLSAAAARIRDHHPQLSVVTGAAEDTAVKALVRESEGADLTVVGTRGLGRATGTLFGSVSLRLVGHTHGPVLVVRGDHRCDGEREVLLGLESDADVDAAAYAFQEAERRGVRLRVLHAWTHWHEAPELPSLIPGTSPGQREAARREAGEDAVGPFDVAALRQRYTGVGVETVTVRTDPAHALLEATREAGLVVIGARRHGRGAEPRLGAVGHTLLHRSHCPVVVVPSR
ncbi:universal stress protein [Streptomyces canus]|uniref:universal stress protein n=1 Tax=Streptomyces canus TaxID=58343 RepID=UPI0018F87765|nr:universal stress protein [Streptomyces canus]